MAAAIATEAKRAPAEKTEAEDTLPDADLEVEFGFEALGSTSSASVIQPAMALLQDAAAIIKALNANSDQKIGAVTTRLDRHEGLIVDLSTMVVAL